MSDLPALVAQLRGTLGKLEVAMSAVTDAIVWADGEGRIQWCNASFDRLVGLPHIQILGAFLKDLLPLQRQGKPLPPELHPLHVALHAQLSITNYYEFRQADGALVLEISAKRVQIPEEGRGAVLVVLDITERKKAEEQLEGKVKELEKLNRIMMDREERILELKGEVKTLRAQLGTKP